MRRRSPESSPGQASGVKSSPPCWTDRASIPRGEDHIPAEVALIGYQDQGNLGMGYLAAALQERGHTVQMIDVRDGPAEIADRLAPDNPWSSGSRSFSRPSCRSFVASLATFVPRASPATSLSAVTFRAYAATRSSPSFLNSTASCAMRASLTLLDLVERLIRGKEWRETRGIAYLRAGHILETEPRPLDQDLDSLPLPYRPLYAGEYWRVSDASATGESRLRAPLYLLFHSHVLSDCAGESGSRPQAGQSDRGNAIPGSLSSGARYSFPGRRLPAVARRRPAMGRRAGATVCTIADSRIR